MPLNLTVNGTTYPYPQTGEEDWGDAASNWAQAVTQGMLQKAGGAFALTAEVDFGANFGLKSTYFKSRAANPASAGQVRLGNTEKISWRNAANGANLDLLVNASDQLLFNGNQLLTSTGSLGASRAMVTNGASVITTSAVTATELGYLSGVTSAIQTQLDAKAAAADLTTLDGEFDTHVADTSAHGVTGDVVGTSDTQTLTNKTLTSPTINTGTLSDPLLNGMRLGFADVSSADTATAADVLYLCNATGGAFTLSLPAAASNVGRLFAAKKIDSSANAVTLDPNSAEQIEFLSTWGLYEWGDSALFFCDGTKWILIASHYKRQVEKGTTQTSNGIVASSSFVAYSAGNPTLTFTARRSGKFRVWADICWSNDTASGTAISHRIAATAGAPSTIYQVQTRWFNETGGYIRWQRVEAVFACTQGTSYTFALQGACSGGTSTLRNSDLNSCLQAEELT